MTPDTEEPIPSEGEKDVTFYYPRCRYANGNLYMAASFYGPTTIGHGACSMFPTSPDYYVWLWIMTRLSSFEAGRISSKDLPNLRIEFEKACQQAESPASFRESLLAKVPVCLGPTRSEQFWEGFNEILLRMLIIVGMGIFYVFKFLFTPFRWISNFFGRRRKAH